MRVNFYLKDSRSKNETLIYCLLRYQNLRVKHYTNRKIDPKHWNSKEQAVRKSHPNSPELNHWLNKIRTYLDKIELEWSGDHDGNGIVPVIPPSYFKRRLDEYFSKTTKEQRQNLNQKTLWGYYETFLIRMKDGSRVNLSKGTPIARKTIFQFENLKRHLQNFEKYKKVRLEFENIDLSFYNTFVQYLTTKLNLSPNTIAKLITNLKVFLREAFDEGVTNNNIFTNRRFRANTLLPESIYLNPYEINQILNIDLSLNSRLERVRDTFIIGCYTGLRFSDLINIKPENIIDDMIEIVQVKTKDRVVIPLRKEVKILLAKYDNSLRKISTQKFNDYLYDVVKKCDLLKDEISIKTIQGGREIVIKKPKYEFVTSHTARRSFATNEYMLKGLSVRDIMAITGHKTEKSFYRYIRQTPKENAERVKIIWQEREKEDFVGGLKVVN